MQLLCVHYSVASAGASRMECTHHVLHESCAVKLSAIGEKLFEELILRDHIILELNPSWAEHGSRQSEGHHRAEWLSQVCRVIELATRIKIRQRQRNS